MKGVEGMPEISRPTDEESDKEDFSDPKFTWGKGFNPPVQEKPAKTSRGGKKKSLGSFKERIPAEQLLDGFRRAAREHGGLK